MAVVGKTVAVTVEGKPLSAIPEKYDPYATPKDKWRYVTVPERDMYDHKFGPVEINEYKFEGGKHFVPPDLADEIERIVKAHEEYLLHLMQPKKRKEVISSVNQGSPGTVY